MIPLFLPPAWVSIRAWLASRPWDKICLWLAIFVLTVIIAVGLALFSYGNGIRDEQVREARQQGAALARAAQDARDAQAWLDAATAPVIVSTAAKIDHVRTVTKTIVERVHDYVTPAADARCVIPVGFVRLHDAAAAGEDLPAADRPGVDDGAASPFALSDVGRTVVDNYGTCNAIREQLIGLQTIVKAYQAETAK